MAAVCAGLYPSVCRVIRPPKRFTETRGGSQEIEISSDALRWNFYFQLDFDMCGHRYFVSFLDLAKPVEFQFHKDTLSRKVEEELLTGLSEVFLHPGSVLSTNKIQSK